MDEVDLAVSVLWANCCQSFASASAGWMNPMQILAISSHFRPQEARNPWQVLYKRGFRAIRVSIYPKVILQ